MGGNIFRGLVVNPVSPDRLDCYRYLVIENGKIIEATNEDPRPGYSERGFCFEDLEDRVILPGLVDTHVHIPQYPNLAIGGEMELLDWLKEYTFPAETRFKDPDYAYKVASALFRDMLNVGTTAISAFATVHEDATHACFDAANDAGIRANIGKVMMDRRAFSGNLAEETQESLAAARRIAQFWDGKANGRLHYVVTPRFAPTSTLALMRGAARMARDMELRVQTHLSENKGEIDLVKKLFGRESYTALYEEMGLMGRGSIMAHSIYLSPKEIITMQRTRTGIAHCPCSNSFLHSGIMPYSAYKARGLIMGLGSDISGGYDLSILQQMRSGMEHSKLARTLRQRKGVMGIADALYLATLGGARVLKMDDRIGNFEPGKEADFIVVKDPNPLGNLNPNRADHTLQRVCYGAQREHVERTYVGGELVHPA